MFKMTRAEFYALAKWRQKAKKKERWCEKGAALRHVQHYAGYSLPSHDPDLPMKTGSGSMR
eukprot:scaffold481_cov238-Pinguiococcus_pyrenoidosus.AAC.8